jgi:hypothetical protein
LTEKKSTKEKLVTAPSKIQEVIEPKETVKQEVKPLEQVVYIGPTIREVQSHSTFLNKLPLPVEETLKKYPYLKGLFIKVTEVPQALQNLKKPGSKEALLYEKAMKEAK